MLKGVEHIGIAVADASAAQKTFEALFGTEVYKIEEVASEGVRTYFYQVGNVKLELLEATNPSSPIAKFIEKNGGKGGIHHIAFSVENLPHELKRLQAAGFSPLELKPGADNKLICFLHPKNTAGVLVELCQDLLTL